MVSSKADNTSSVPQVQLDLVAALDRELSGKLFLLPGHAWKEYGHTYGVNRVDAFEVFKILGSEKPFLFDMLVDLTCVDWMDVREPRFDVVYQLLSVELKHRLCIKIKVSEEDAEVDSVRSIWASADFMEREAWDMFGVNFAGHGDLRRILMYDEFVGHPLKKDYPKMGKQPRVPLRVPELRNTSADMERQQLVALPVRNRRTAESR